MLYLFDPYYSAVHILTESEKPTRREELAIQAVLEDATSPTTSHYVEKLYESIMRKSHIDFDDIPQSQGNIVNYKGYTSMVEVLENLIKVASDNKSQSVIDYCNVVKKSMNIMRSLAPIYNKGFRLKNQYIMLEYNTFVYTIVQAVSALLYNYVDFMKRPEEQTMRITLKNNKYKANVFYFDQLNKFNHINDSMNYGKYLTSILEKGKDNFTGTEALGLATVVAVALAIVPITRELVWQYYGFRSNLSDCLAQQAYFLEMNKTVVEANSDFNQKKKDAILIKQEKIKNLCLRLSEKLRVEHAKAIDNGRATIQSENKLLTLDNVKKEVDNSALGLL